MLLVHRPTNSESILPPVSFCESSRTPSPAPVTTGPGTRKLRTTSITQSLPKLSKLSSHKFVPLAYFAAPIPFLKNHNQASRPEFPLTPALRANPYPEVTDPACRLPLPTLFQHARGCSPWRPAADMGTARREIYTLSPGFSRASESSPDAAGTATLSKARAPLSGRTHSRAPCPSQRKENSPRGSRRLLRDRLRYRTGRLAAPISATPDSGI